MYKIPFNKPFIVGKELYYIAQTVLQHCHTAGDGIFTKKCQTFMEKTFEAKKVLLTHSCTAALEMAAMLTGIEPGDEVVLPSFTFVSTANAFYLRGAKLVFSDIRADTLNIDERKIESVLTKKTKAIVPVHYAGIACEMDSILETARKYEVHVVEDAAQAVNSKYKGKYLGTLGDIGTFSFHETKNLIAGEGGAIVLNNDKYFDRAEIIREKGTNRKKFYRGEVDKYTWVDIGSSYLPSDMIAAFLFAQLENMDHITKRRRKIYNRYYSALKSLAYENKLRLPYSPGYCDPNYHLFHIILDSEATRNRLMAFLKSKGILSVFHYIPLHLSTIGRSMGYKMGDLPLTESVSCRLLRLPLYFEMTHHEQQYIIDRINEFF